MVPVNAKRGLIGSGDILKKAAVQGMALWHCDTVILWVTDIRDKYTECDHSTLHIV